MKIEAKARLQSSAPKFEFHGHVVPDPSGMKARCGGTALRCSTCAQEEKMLAAGTHPYALGKKQ